MRIQTRALKFGICTDTQRGARIARHCTFPRRRNARVPACILSSYVVSNASRKSPRDFGLYLLFSTSIRVFCGYFLAVLNLVSVICYRRYCFIVARYLLFRLLLFIPSFWQLRAFVQFVAVHARYSVKGLSRGRTSSPSVLHLYLSREEGSRKSSACTSVRISARVSTIV